MSDYVGGKSKIGATFGSWGKSSGVSHEENVIREERFLRWLSVALFLDISKDILEFIGSTITNSRSLVRKEFHIMKPLMSRRLCTLDVTELVGD